MKLPQIQYSQAQGATTLSPGQAAAPHLAKARAIGSIADMAQNVYKMKIEYDVNNNTADYGEAMEAVDGILSDRLDNYTGEELDAIGISGLVDVDENGEAEAWRVYPYALAKIQEDLLEQMGGKIKSASHRKAWAATMRDSWKGTRKASVQKAATMAIEDMKNEQIRRYREAIALGKYDIAIQALDPSFFGSTPALERERSNLILEAKKAKAVDSLAEISETGTSAAIKSASDSIIEQLEESDTGLIRIGGADVSRTTALTELGKLKRAEGAREAEEVEFEEESYWAILRSEDAERISSLKKEISGDDYKGSMDEFKRVQWQTRINSALGTGKVKLSIDSQVQVNNIMDRLDVGTKALELGDDINTINLEKDIETLEALPKKALSDSEKIKIREFRIAQKEYEKSAKFRALPLQVQSAKIAELKNNPQRTPAQKMKLSRLEQINAGKRKLLDDDSVLYAQEYRGAKVNLLLPGTDSFPEEAANRVAIHKGNIEEDGTSTGPLFQAELTGIADNMDSDPGFFLDYIGAIHEAVGEDTRFYLEQLKDIASPSAIVAAEFITMDGDTGRRDAKILSRGTQIRAEGQYNIDKPLSVKRELYARLVKMYPSDRFRADELTEAALDYYVGLQSNPAMLKLVTGEKATEIANGVYELDTDVLTDSVNAVTGGESEIDPDGFGPRYTIPSPVRGWKSDETQSWFDGLSGADMPEIKRGSIVGGKARMSEMIVDGDIHLEPVIGETGKYRLRDMLTGFFVPAPGKGKVAAILTYK